MGRFPKNRHYEPRPSVGSGSPPVVDVNNIAFGAFGASPDYWRVGDGSIYTGFHNTAFTGTINSGQAGTQSIYNQLLIPNNAVVEIELTVLGIKADGNTFRARRAAIFRRDNAGVLVMQSQDAAADIKESAGAGVAVASLALLMNSNFPSATLTMAVASGIYNIQGISRFTQKKI